ncbi:MAG: hypothetical protein CME68_05950 [Halobacteriovoraceae bacterium]|nr:hypothetical protein [Halobacteriovoraceae bacterium]|tara:strand:- start:1145 stop:1678 length:534 start_codon:yes stop_codon:yes gene_type:complete
MTISKINTNNITNLSPNTCSFDYPFYTFFFFLISFLFFSTKAKAITWEVVGPCHKQPIAKGHFKVRDLDKNSVGKTTLSIFEETKLSFEGNEAMIKHIEGFPGKFETIELGGQDYRSLGWCYEINGKQPPLYMNKVYFQSQNDHLTWVLGQASYIEGNWTEYCTPVHRFNYSFFCKE